MMPKADVDRLVSIWGVEPMEHGVLLSQEILFMRKKG